MVEVTASHPCCVTSTSSHLHLPSFPSSHQLVDDYQGFLALQIQLFHSGYHHHLDCTRSITHDCTQLHSHLVHSLMGGSMVEVTVSHPCCVTSTSSHLHLPSFPSSHQLVDDYQGFLALQIQLFHSGYHHHLDCTRSITHDCTQLHSHLVHSLMGGSMVEVTGYYYHLAWV
ncbi:hypothetical protein Pcinc_032365 [Petrolisthes cinctipes]|uniref:Uncharacterized protein n=1 Tax=Petrolisthes cinctipes TaxID=88211 RepID=A0AAE1K343_PETCI|nr:hypothetical protein Pcinc_032365 [Petrolisthes cinctipes]